MPLDGESPIDELSPAGDEAALAYRPVSTPALVGLALGLISPVVFLSPSLWVVPLAGAAVSLAAARSVAASGGARVGFGFAAAGLSLSLAVGAAAYARGAVLRSSRAAAADDFATEFFRRLSDRDVQGAFLLRLALGDRPATTAAADALFASDEEAAESLALFEAKAATRSLVGAPPPRAAGPAEFEPRGYGRIRVTRLYRPPGDGRPVRLTLERAPTGAGGLAAWRVFRFDFAG